MLATAAKFAVDGHIEQGGNAVVLGQLETNADRPDMFWIQ